MRAELRPDGSEEAEGREEAMKGLGVTPQQSGDLMLGFRGILIVRYGLLGEGSISDWSVAAAGVVSLSFGMRARLKRRGL